MGVELGKLFGIDFVLLDLGREEFFLFLFLFLLKVYWVVISCYLIIGLNGVLKLYNFWLVVWNGKFEKMMEDWKNLVWD